MVIKLLEVTHGQWFYRNVIVHDLVGDIEAFKRKQELQMEIERQIEVEGERLNDQDQYLLEINLEELERSLREDRCYWLLAVRATMRAEF